MDSESQFFDAVLAWVHSERAIESAVLHGSKACSGAQSRIDEYSDVDLHVVAKTPRVLYAMQWTSVLPAQRYCFHAAQRATGGTSKLIVLFERGQLDIVVVSRSQMSMARWAMHLGLHRRFDFVREPLNELATNMSAGYRFLRGERKWGDVYRRVVAEMAGVRLNDSSIEHLADAFLVNLLTMVKRLKRGEFVAVQYWLHRHLVETNLKLSRELQQRRGILLPSFGLGRRVESSLPPEELSWIQVSARLESNELLRAAVCAYEGMRALMTELVPQWQVPLPVVELLVRCAPEFGRSPPSRLRTE